MAKIIVAGSRNITGVQLVEDAINTALQNWGIPLEDITLISGGCKGVDALGEHWAYTNKVRTKVFPAEWAKYGFAAGPMRNKQMAKYASHLILVWDGMSRGSANMLKEAEKTGLDISVAIVELK